jgi:hypothetical protein
MTATLSWPFEAILDGAGRAADWVALHGPVTTSAQQDLFAELRHQGARFVGVTSYLDFPRGAGPLDYEAVCEVWCHCFRDPEAYLSQGAPRALISASDFSDSRHMRRCVEDGTPAVAFDYLYVGSADPWKKAVKNWPLAARCIPEINRTFGLKALVIGAPDETFALSADVAFLSSLPWPALLRAMASARFLFVPNVRDPSPRIVAEALCLDVPVLMNEAILGGWKYVNRFTGRFFESERDVLEATARVLARGLRPCGWFRANFGPELSARRLTALVRSVDPSLAPDSGLHLSPAGPAPPSPV